MNKKSMSATLIIILGFSISMIENSFSETFPGENGLVAFVLRESGERPDIFIMNPDGSNQRILYDDSADNIAASAPSWSPNGKHIAFYGVLDSLGFDGLGIWIINADGSGLRQLHYSFLDAFPTWSPDGKMIAFGGVVGESDNMEIYLMNIDGTNLRNLSNYDDGDDSHPSWSPNGEQIAFTSDRDFDGYSEIYVMDANGSNQQRLTNNPTSGDVGPNWTPDGEKILFSSARDGNYELYLMDPNGDNQERLTFTPNHDESGVVSPDGEKIIFSMHDPLTSTSDIYVMDFDGNNIERLTFNADSSNGVSSWAPFNISEKSKTSITIIKKIINDDYGTATIDDFIFMLNSVSSSDESIRVFHQIPKLVSPGKYIVSESGPGEYSHTFSGDCDANGRIIIQEGQQLECTITNNDLVLGSQNTLQLLVPFIVIAIVIGFSIYTIIHRR